MTHSTEAIAQTPAHPASGRKKWIRLLANRNFRLLWLGENVSLLGDQFYFIALPWLVFQMTDSALAFGTILMVAGIPRAVLMLVGGVMTDRITPRSVMILSNLFRLIITILLTLLVIAQTVELWMLYAIAFCFGSVDAFFHPAYRSIMPFIVDEDNLQASNSLMQAAAQLVQTVGPGVAGIIVRSIGAALSFAFDAVTFLFTSIMLWMMHPAAIPSNSTKPAVNSKLAGIFTDINEVLIYTRRDKLLTTLILVVAAINLFFVGRSSSGRRHLARSVLRRDRQLTGPCFRCLPVEHLSGL